MFNQLTKILTVLFVIFCLIFSDGFLCVKTAYADVINNDEINFINKDKYDWSKIDKLLADEVRNSLFMAEEFATEELDNYINKLMVNVDEKFLNWYFSFWNQKGMEYGSSFDWVVLKLDEPLKVFRKEDEKNLNSGEVINKRLTKNLYKKFQELVFTESAQQELKKIIERTGKLYGRSISLVFADVKNYYKIADQDWDNHLGELAKLIYDTGNSKSSLSIESLSSSLLTETAVIGAVIGAKLFSNVAIKAGSKLMVKSGSFVVLSTTSQLVDPLLAIGFIPALEEIEAELINKLPSFS